jgi:hypothetical protein
MGWRLAVCRVDHRRRRHQLHHASPEMGMIAGARDLGFRVGGEFLKAAQNPQADHRRHIAKHRASGFGDGASLQLRVSCCLSKPPPSGEVARLDHPIPACRIVAVILPPALDSALVSLIAETWLNDQGRTDGDEGGDGADARLQHLEMPVPVLIMVMPVIAKPDQRRHRRDPLDQVRC